MSLLKSTWKSFLSNWMSHCFQMAQVNSIASNRRIAMFHKHPGLISPFLSLSLRFPRWNWHFQGGIDGWGWQRVIFTVLTLCSIVLMLSIGGGSTVGLMIPHLLMAAVHAVERISVSTDSAKTMSHCPIYGTNSTLPSTSLWEKRTLSLCCRCPGSSVYLSLMFMFPDTEKMSSTSYICPLEVPSLKSGPSDTIQIYHSAYSLEV